MRVLLINVPHTAIGSRIPDDHVPPLGLLAVAGPLIDDGHTVHLIDAEFGPMPLQRIVEQALAWQPDIVMFGHSGSTSAHPTITRVARQIHQQAPELHIVYGGVYPTYHWREILTAEPWVRAVVRGEGEETARRLVSALQHGQSLTDVQGLAIRVDNQPFATPDATVIKHLDDYRIAWELIDHRNYSYWGGKRAVAMQLSRGCPHQCTYCGQRGFWSRWRYRDPVLFAREIGRLHREHGVEVISLADENPTSSKRIWKLFLNALIEENVDVIVIGTTRAGDIVRDADILHLYRQAGVTRFLLGLENTDENTLEKIKKGSTTSVDRQAIQLMRQYGIISMASWVVGFEEETDADYWRGLRQLLSYDPDQIQMLYVTPHRWTPYFNEASHRKVIQTDQRRWDYKHQVLATRHMPAWRVLLWFKLTEVVLQTRPKALYRTFMQPDRRLRYAMRWYSKIGKRVWPYEILRFFKEKLTTHGPTLAEYWGKPQHNEEYAMSIRPVRIPAASISTTSISTTAPARVDADAAGIEHLNR